MNFEKLMTLASSQSQNKTDLIKKSKTKSTGPDPKAVEKFLIEKRLQEIRKEEEDRMKVNQLLSLRKQNSKSHKKAKLMANRTKDNDFSKIVLTDKDIQNKERIDAELRKKGIDHKDKLDRMKQRIELDYEEEDQPVRRRKKSYKNATDDSNYNYSYEKVKKCRDEVINRSSKEHSKQEQNIKQSQSKTTSTAKPTSFEEILRLANQSKDHQKTLEQEIEEELLAKKNRSNKDNSRRRDELYYQSSTNQVKAKNGRAKSNTVDAISSSSRHEHRASKDQRDVRKNIDDKKYNKDVQSNVAQYRKREEKPIERRTKTAISTSSNFLPPISQVLKRENVFEKKTPESKEQGARNNVASILSNIKSGGSLSDKIASLSKDELLELSKAVDKVKKEKKKSPSTSEYSPRATHFHEEYKPKDFGSSSKSPYNATSSKSTNREPVYIPTKIKSDRDEPIETYCPVNNYKSTEKSTMSSNQNRKLFDIDSLTLEEIEKIKQDRLNKQKREQTTNCQNRSSSKNDSIMKMSSQTALPSKTISKSQSSLSTERFDSSRSQYRDRERLDMRRQLPIGATYRRGDYDDDYGEYNDEEYEDEEDDEMRDFIDDGDDCEMQSEVTKAIQELFPRYNKRRFIDDDDDEVEESSYAQQMREENYSSRIGYLEDLEEERKQDAERKRKRKAGIISSDEDD